MDREALGRGGRVDETRVQVFVAENDAYEDKDDNGDDFDFFLFNSDEIVG